MSNLDKLKERGAQVVGGDLVLRHKVVGRFIKGEFLTTEDGLLELDTVEVVAKEVKPAKELKAPKVKKAKEEVQETPAETADAEVTIDV